jgi:hypothetical protein
LARSHTGSPQSCQAASQPTPLRHLAHLVQISALVNQTFPSSSVPLLHFTLEDALSATALVPSPSTAVASAYFTATAGGGAATAT